MSVARIVTSNLPFDEWTSVFGFEGPVRPERSHSGRRKTDLGDDLRRRLAFRDALVDLLPEALPTLLHTLPRYIQRLGYVPKLELPLTDVP
jgi:hypothetical protein